MQTGRRYDAKAWDELSTIDTTLLLGGVLFAAVVLRPATAKDEKEIRQLADEIYRRVDWKWASPRAPLVAMGWTPEAGFIHVDWRGYNEAMLLYVLALGSPTYAVEPAAWKAWTENYDATWGSFQGQEHLGFAPLFGHQYSHVWIDFRGIRDEYMREHDLDYFENSRRATFAQREYAIHNPMQWTDYGSDDLGPDRVQRSARGDAERRARPLRERSEDVLRLHRARRRPARHDRRRHDRADRGRRRRSRSRPRSSSRRSPRCRSAMASTSTRSTASSMRSIRASRSPTVRCAPAR